MNALVIRGVPGNRSMRYILPVFWLFVVTALGCSSLAKQTPTPANDIPPNSYRDIAPPAGEHYYLMIFGSESRIKRAKFTHTWATMVRVNESDSTAMEPHTISWMPATLDIKALARKVEPGTNLELKFTIEEMLRHGEHVVMWGPYEVPFGLYQRFLVQKRFMESGTVGYQCIDSIGEAARTGLGCNCIHAVTDMDPLYDRQQYPLSYFGISGSRNVVKQIHERPTIIGPNRCHTWVATALGLDDYPIERKKWDGRTLEYTQENVEAQSNARKWLKR